MIDTYDKLTIGKYIKILKVVNSDINDIEKKIELVALLNDMEINDVENLPIGTFQTYLQSVSFLFDEPKKKIVNSSYKVGKYNLELTMNLQNITVAQYIDYQNFVLNVNENLVQLLAVFLIPKGKEYNEGYDIIDVQKEIAENMTVTDAVSIADFFLLVSQSLTKATLGCLKRKMRKMMKTMTPEEKKKMEQVIANLENAGNGLQQLIE